MEKREAFYITNEQFYSRLECFFQIGNFLSVSFFSVTQNSTSQIKPLSSILKLTILFAFQMKMCQVRERLKILLLVSSQFKQISYLLFPSKSSENDRFSSDFRENSQLSRLNLRNIRSEICRRHSQKWLKMPICCIYRFFTTSQKAASIYVFFIYPLYGAMTQWLRR